MKIVDRINKIKCADRLQELYIELKWRLSELEEHNQMLVELKNGEHENKEYHIELCKDKITWLSNEIEELKELIKECLEFLRML